MRIPPFLPNEDARLVALNEYGVDSENMESELEKIVELTSNLFDAPIVLVSLLERERQFFTAKVGTDICETDRNISFCAHAIAQSDVFVVLDATLDSRFFDNPVVTGGPKIRFYAGAPLVAPSGYGLGTLCIIDTKPRNSFSDSDRRNLKDIAALVLDKMELHRLDKARRTSQVRFEQIAATSPDGNYLCKPAGNDLFLEPGCLPSLRLYGRADSRAKLSILSCRTRCATAAQTTWKSRQEAAPPNGSAKLSNWRLGAKMAPSF